MELTFQSNWNPCIDKPVNEALNKEEMDGCLDLGCIGTDGHFEYNQISKKYEYTIEGKPVTKFLFKLITLLQAQATVPMIDIKAYATMVLR